MNEWMNKWMKDKQQLAFVVKKKDKNKDERGREEKLDIVPTSEHIQTRTKRQHNNNEKNSPTSKGAKRNKRGGGGEKNVVTKKDGPGIQMVLRKEHNKRKEKKRTTKLESLMPQIKQNNNN